MTTQPAESRINWHSFSAAPHRMFFWSGTSFGLAAVALWSAQQASLYTNLWSSFHFSVPYPAAHGFMMTFGWLGFFIFGFLLTTFPRWLDSEPIPRGAYLAAWTAQTTGVVTFWVGLLLNRHLVTVGVLLLGLGYTIAIVSCLRVLLASRTPGRMQQTWVIIALTTGTVAIFLSAWGFATGDHVALKTARLLGLHPYLLGVILTVVYRMVPFFTSMVSPDLELRRTSRAVVWFAVTLWVRTVLAILEQPHWTWLPDLVLLALLVREIAVWRFWRANFPPLLLILYIALGWLAASFALSGWGGLASFLVGGPALPLGNAALHALTLGGFGSLVLGIGTRVSLGHSGQGLATDRLLAVLFLTFQLAPLLRIFPELLAPWWPVLRVHGFWSGLVWLVVFGIWLARIGPALMRPRSDGRPG